MSAPTCTAAFSTRFTGNSPASTVGSIPSIQTRGGAPASRGGGKLLLRGAVSFDRRRIRFRSSTDFAGLPPAPPGNDSARRLGRGTARRQALGFEANV